MKTTKQQSGARLRIILEPDKENTSMPPTRPRRFNHHYFALFAVTMWLPLHGPSAQALAEETLVAVAANFSETADALKPEFERASGHTLVVTTGSTGSLYAQIVAGAPFQVFLSADASTPARLEEEGIAVAGTGFTYAVGKLTLWSADSGRITADGRQLSSG